MYSANGIDNYPHDNLIHYNKLRKDIHGIQQKCNCGCGQKCQCHANCKCGCNSHSKHFDKEAYLHEYFGLIPNSGYQNINSTQTGQSPNSGYRIANLGLPQMGLNPNYQLRKTPGPPLANQDQNRHLDLPKNQIYNPGIENCGELTTGSLNRLCKMSETEFKKIDPNATILPKIGLPSENKGVCTILHGMGPHAHNLKINGLESKSPLANAALFSTECSDNKYLNLYEMMLPEGNAKTPGHKSNAELYAQDLNNQKINVAGTHWHWWASEPYVAAIHHQNVGMNPVEFTNKTVDALLNYNNRANSGSYK